MFNFKMQMFLLENHKTNTDLIKKKKKFSVTINIMPGIIMHRFLINTVENGKNTGIITDTPI